LTLLYQCVRAVITTVIVGCRYDIDATTDQCVDHLGASTEIIGRPLSLVDTFRAAGGDNTFKIHNAEISFYQRFNSGESIPSIGGPKPIMKPPTDIHIPPPGNRNGPFRFVVITHTRFFHLPSSCARGLVGPCA